MGGGPGVAPPVFGLVSGPSARPVDLGVAAAPDARGTRQPPPDQMGTLAPVQWTVARAPTGGSGPGAPDLFTVEAGGSLNAFDDITNIKHASNLPDTRPRCELQAICLVPMELDEADEDAVRTLSAQNVLECEMHSDAIAELLNAAVSGGLLDTPMADWLTFGMRISAAVGFPVEAKRLVSMATTEKFTAGQPCPDQLKYLTLVTVYDLLAAGRTHTPDAPGELLARLVRLLAHTARRAARISSSAPVSVAGGLLRLYLAEWASLPVSAPDALLARQLPAYLAAAAQALPAWLRTASASPAAALDELRDCHMILRGRPEEAASVVWRRVADRFQQLPGLGALAPAVKGAANVRAACEQLGMILGVSASQSSTASLVQELDSQISQLNLVNLISTSVEAGVDLQSIFAEISTACQANRAPSGRAGAAPGSAVMATTVMHSSDTLSDATPLSSMHVMHALGAPEFRELAAHVEAMVPEGEHNIEILDRAHARRRRSSANRAGMGD